MPSEKWEQDLELELINSVRAIAPKMHLHYLYENCLKDVRQKVL